MSKCTVLVVDAMGDNIPKISAAIRPFSSRLMWADNLEEGRRLLTEGRPDLILVSDDTPGLKDPLEFLELAHCHKLPTQLVVLTRTPDFDEAMDLVAKGVFSVLSIPLNMDKLRTVLRKILENLSLLRTLVIQDRTDSEKELAIHRRLSAAKGLSSLYTAIKEAVCELFVGSTSVLELSEELNAHLQAKSETEEEEMFSFDKPTKLALPTYDLVRELNYNNVYLGKLILSFPHPQDGELPESFEAFEELILASSIHLYQARQYHEAVKLASRDPLTSLVNRRVFMENLDREFARAKRHNTPLSLIMLDIDHFKSVNDTFGHQTGDTVLKWLAQVLTETVRTGDVVGRIGGEEFAIMLPWTDVDQANNLASRIRTALASSMQPTSSNLLKPTISQGIATSEHFLINSSEDLLYWSDQAMYLAKKEGRDTIRLASDLQPKKEFEESSYVFQ
ncbi:MAG: diguanylate cyclase [Deltaproteobacteria bacterium]|jgi:diguanylate cyclase (GGDEF)-like protein|nr:diguanylate cyclase [Deltaproteobacteria bacterium]